MFWPSRHSHLPKPFGIKVDNLGRAVDLTQFIARVPQENVALCWLSGGSNIAGGIRDPRRCLRLLHTKLQRAGRCQFTYVYSGVNVRLVMCHYGGLINWILSNKTIDTILSRPGSWLYDA